MARLLPDEAAGSSSSAMLTKLPSAYSTPRARSSYATSSPQLVQTLRKRTGAQSVACSRRKPTSASSIAGYSRTATFSSARVMVPFQTALMAFSLLVGCLVVPGCGQEEGARLGPLLLGVVVAVLLVPGAPAVRAALRGGPGQRPACGHERLAGALGDIRSVGEGGDRVHEAVEGEVAGAPELGHDVALEAPRDAQAEVGRRLAHVALDGDPGQLVKLRELLLEAAEDLVDGAPCPLVDLVGAPPAPAVVAGGDGGHDGAVGAPVPQHVSREHRGLLPHEAVGDLHARRPGVALTHGAHGLGHDQAQMCGRQGVSQLVVGVDGALPVAPGDRRKGCVEQAEVGVRGERG